MIVKFNEGKYDLNLLRAFKLRIEMLWFPLRRLFRAAKRDVKNLNILGGTLLVFLPLAGVLFYLAVKFELFLPEEAVQELLLIILGSFVLLAVRETLEFEKQRTVVLKKQEQAYYEARIEFRQYINEIRHYFKLKPRYDIFPYAKDYSESVKDCVSQIRESGDFGAEINDVSILAAATDRLKQFCIEFRAQVFRDGFEREKGEGLSAWLAALTDCLVDLRIELDKTPDKASTGHCVRVIYDMKNVLDCVRSPWRLTMDFKYTEKLKQKYERYKVQEEKSVSCVERSEVSLEINKTSY